MTPARAAELDVRWRTPDGTAVPQGLPLRYEAVVDNPSHGAITLSMSFEVHPDGEPERAVPFDRWTGSVAGGSTLRIRGRVTPAQWFAERGGFRVSVRSSADVPGLRFRVTDPPVVPPVFEDVTDEVGLGTRHQAAIECDGYAAGAAWGDVDGDGDLDLFLPHQDGPSQLWVNEGGHFTEGAAARGVTTEGDSAIAAVFADYDNDADQDLYVVNDGPNRLFRNDGSGRFSDVAAAAGVAEPGPGSSASWGDYDRDGHLDLFVVNWARCGSSFDYTYADDALFHNEGDGTFTNQTELLESTGSTTGAGFQGAWFDYDRDGDVDLYLANDYGGPRPEGNYLWRNDGAGPRGWRFTNVSTASGTGLHMNTMGIAVGDYDRDLDLDMALSNIEATALLRNRGDGTFRDVAGRAGVGRPNQRVREKAITWGLAFSDLNLDGWEDLYVVGGSLAQENRPEPQPNATFANLGSGRFADLSAVGGAADDQVGRGLSLADFDRDGRMDLYVVNQGGRPILYRNVTPRGPRHWLEVDLEGTTSNGDACGATLVARAGRTKLLRQVFCGSVGLGGGSDPVVHFGLGRRRTVDSLRIAWPSGLVQTLRDVAADRLIEVEEPNARTRASARFEPEDDPWFIESFDQFRPEAPPEAGSEQTRRELRDLLRLQRRRTPRQVRLARRWGQGPATVPWTRVALEAIRTQRSGAFPTRSARALAVLHLGLHDALEAADDARRAYHRRRPARADDRIDPVVRAGGTSYPDERAVAAGAAGTLLRYLFPDAPEGKFERLAKQAALSRLWGGVSHRSDVEAGLGLGRSVAAVAIERAEADGHKAEWDFEDERLCSTERCAGEDEAHWTPTPTGFQYPPTDPMASKWETYLMASPGEFLPPPPPAYGSPEFMTELEEVKRLSSEASEDDQELAFFWDDGPGTYSPAGHWNDIAIDLVRNRGFDTMETAETFALMNAALRDAFVATWHAKYHYWSIRPVTVIRRETVAGRANPYYDPGWLPNLSTPPFPAYPSGHSAESAAAARVLQYLMPDSGERSKAIAAEMGPAGSIDELAEEVAYSRLLGGIHFRSDNDAALILGRRIAALAIERGP